MTGLRHVAAVAVLLALLGCLRDPGVVAWEAELVRAERLIQAGNAEGALPVMRRLHDDAPSEPYRVESAERIAECLVALHRDEEAGLLYLDVARSTEDREIKARLLFRAARVTYDRPSSQEDGLALLVRLVDEYPDTVAGLRSLQYVQAHFGGTPEGRRWLLAFYRDRFDALRSSPLADNLLLGAAEIHAGLHTPDDDRVALGLLLDLTAAFPRAGLWDDSMWRRAELQHRLGLFRDEVATLGELLQTREVPTFFGNYETRYYHRGQYRLARLLRDALGDNPGAIAAFETFVRTYRFSSFWDDALYQLAELYLGAGRTADAQAAADELTRERPESRWASRVQVLVRTGHDPGPPPPWSDPTVPWSYDEEDAP